MDKLSENLYFRDVFLSHANLDKEQYIKPFVEVLEEREITYWYDEAELSWGNSLLAQLSDGLSKSKFVTVFITDQFLERNWPQAELRTAMNEEITTGTLKVLPIIICEPEKILKLHPFLRDKKYLRWNNEIPSMVEELEKVLGRSYSNKWTFSHPKEFRGHVWIKIIPKNENKKKIHEFTIEWGRWEYKGKIDFKKDSSVILDFKKISEERSWPIEFSITPSAFVISGRGNPVIDINKGWKCKDNTGKRKAMIRKRVQSIMPDTNKDDAVLIE